jgi:purine-cytosine permease-like protein
MKAGLGMIALVIVIFSTVTTTSLMHIRGSQLRKYFQKAEGKACRHRCLRVGMLLAIFTPITQFENFLYLIGSVFAPMIAILIADYFILKKDNSAKAADWMNLGLWVIGFILYRVLMRIDTPVGTPCRTCLRPEYYA